MNVKLTKFNRLFFKTLAGCKDVLIKDKGFYYTIICDGEKTGVVGFVPALFPKSGFVQIVVAPSFRGRGLVRIAESLLAKKRGLKILYATVKKRNVASIKSHKKAGFHLMKSSELNFLRVKGLLKNEEVRLVRFF